MYFFISRSKHYSNQIKYGNDAWLHSVVFGLYDIKF